MTSSALKGLYFKYDSNACFIYKIPYLKLLLIWLIFFFFREFELVRESMHSAISMNKTEVLDAVLNDFSSVGFYNIIGNAYYHV